MKDKGQRRPKKDIYNDATIDHYTIEARQKVMVKGFNKGHIFENIVLTPRQLELYNMIRHNTFTIITGPAGTAKTFVACYTALQLLADGKIGDIILTKPIVEAGENLGFLPGTKDEKIDPYFQSYYNNFTKITPKGSLEWLKGNGHIKYEPLAYMRGSTFDNCLMIGDEFQNANLHQIMLWITRLGKNSKAIMMGDISQYDLKKKKDVQMDNFIKNVAKGVNGVAHFQFTKEDIVRNKFLIDLVDNYEKYKMENNL